jgi:integrase/recombinase XerD
MLARQAQQTIVQSSNIIPASTTDEQVVELWLHERSPNTVQAYRRDVQRFLDFIAPRGLHEATLADLQRYSRSLEELAPSSRKRMLSAVKSLLSFASKTGYLALNVGAALRLPKPRDRRAERILTEAQVIKMIALESDPQKHLLLLLLYVSAARISELVQLRWRDVQPSGEAGQIALLGKGDKVRVIALTKSAWEALESKRPEGVKPDAPVFSTRNGKPIDRRWAGRIVKDAAKRAKLPANVSPHWLRHAHASHSLDHGAPISLVQQTLGHSNMATTGGYLHARPKESSARYLRV